MTCERDHAGEVSRKIAELEDSQAGFWRHKCAGCAYLLGVEHGEMASAARAKKLEGRIAELELELEQLKAAG
jgi:hypothetical protein